MDFITLFTFSAIGLIILAVVITRLSKYQIEKKALLSEISNSAMNFDKIDELKKRNLSLKYLLKLQETEQLTIEAKLLTAESIEEKMYLYERALSLPSKGFRKTVEGNMVQTIRLKIGKLEALSAPDHSEIILKDLLVIDNALKDIEVPDIQDRIYRLKAKHASQVRKETMEKASHLH